jgi:hypothetical protein
MHIELLWLIPVVAFAGFLFFIAYYAQRRAEIRSREGDLSKEVALFNVGHDIHGHNEKQDNHNQRLRELEKAINMLAASIPTRQEDRQPEQKETKAAGGTSEIDDLKEKLRTVFREYDIVLSENYSLRARVKQLMKQTLPGDAKTGAENASMDSFLTRTVHPAKPDLHLYGDTRLMKIIESGPDEDEPLLRDSSTR